MSKKITDRRTICVGLTGGIGSGKSTIGKIFNILGVPIFNADQVAKSIVNEDQSVIAAIKDAFGEALYPGGTLDREVMAKIVFNDPLALEALNKIVHPAVGKAYEQWVEDNAAHSYVIKEAAILIESGAYEDMDHIVMVEAPIDVRIQRVMDRDGVTKDQIKKRIASQMTDEEKRKLCDFVIVNDNNRLVIPQVLEIHHILSEGE